MKIMNRFNEFMIVVLMIFSAIFCLLGPFIHLGAFFDFYLAPLRPMMAVGFFGLLIIFYPTAYIVKKITGKLSRDSYRKISVDISPKWMRFILGFLIFYTLGSFAHDIIITRWMQLPIKNEIHALSNKVRVISSLWLLIYFVVFSLLYDCRHLNKYGHPLMESD